MTTTSEDPEVPLGKQQLRVAKLCSLSLEEKVKVAIGIMSKWSIYDRKDQATNELSSGQCLVLGFLYGLAEDDIEMVGLLARLSCSIQSIKYTYVMDWLMDDFNFDRDYVAKAFSRLAVLSDERLFRFDSYLLIALSGLPEKYRLVDYYFFSGDFTALSFIYFLANILREGFLVHPRRRNRR